MKQTQIDTHVAYVADQNSNHLPGAVRVVEPSADTRQFRRGNLYVVVNLSGDQETDDLQQFAEHLTSTIQRTHYTAIGAQSQVLIQAAQAAYGRIQNFNHENPTTPLKLGLICASLLKNRLIIVADNGSLALIGEEKVEVFPEDIINLSLSEEDGDPAGLEIYRRELKTDGAFFLGAAHWLKQVTLRDLAETVAYASGDTCQAIATALSSHSKKPQAMGLLVAFEPSVADRQIAQAGYGSDRLDNVTTISLVHDLPTSVHRAQNELQREPVQVNLTQEQLHPNIISGVHQRAPHFDPPEAQPDLQTIVESRWGMTDGRMAVTTRDRTSRQGDTDIQILIQHVQGWFEVARKKASGLRMPNLAGSRAAISKGTLIPSLPPFTPPEPTRGGRARLYVLLAVLILTSTLLITYYVIQRQGLPSITEAETLMAQAEASLQNAQEIYDEGKGDKLEARSLLTQAESFLADSEKITGYTDESVHLAAEIQSELQSVLQIMPLYQLAEPLVTFPNDALPERLLAINQDLYVLDTGRNIVSYFRTDEVGEFIEDVVGETVLSTGDVVEGIEVGRLADIGWQPLVPGVEDKANLLVLDRNNNIFRYNRIDGVSRIDFGPQNLLQASNRLAIYDGRIYVGDEGRSQLYRYDPGRYDQPVEWFPPQSGINLVELLSIKIDGDIWLLFNDGQLLRYFRGQQKPFILDSSIGLPKEPVDMYIGRQENSLIYIADAFNESIMVFDKDGVYLRQLKAIEGNPLRGLRGIYADEVAENLYILTQSALYQHPISR